MISSIMLFILLHNKCQVPSLINTSKNTKKYSIYFYFPQRYIHLLIITQPTLAVLHLQWLISSRLRRKTPILFTIISFQTINLVQAIMVTSITLYISYVYTHTCFLSLLHLFLLSPMFFKSAPVTMTCEWPYDRGEKN